MFAANLTDPSVYQIAYPYSKGEKTGMIALTAVGGISLLAITALGIRSSITTCRPSPTRKHAPPASSTFLRSQLGIYFLCLLICNFAQALASLLSIRWLTSNAVLPGTATCTAQGVMHQFGNVGSALWTLVIAMHTFTLLFLRVGQVTSWTCLSTFVCIWFVTAGIVAIGPVLVESQEKGPFHGLSGPWCWITEKYTGSKLGLEYFWIFFSAIVSFILYSLVFLRLRGNIVIDGQSVQFHANKESRASTDCTAPQVYESHRLIIARRMLWCPVVYTIAVLPVAICRLIEFGGGDVPLSGTFTTDGIFLLTGTFNAVLLWTVLHLTPALDALPTHIETQDISKFTIGAPQLPPQCRESLDKVLKRNPDSPTSEKGDFGTAQKTAIKFGKPLQRTSTESTSLPRDSSSSEPAVPPSLPILAPLPRTPLPQVNTFATPEGDANSSGPSSPARYSTVSFQSMSPSEVDKSLEVPVHLRPIPIVITTPPSPSPSMRTYATATTIEVDRDHREAMMPTLSRF
ncbi:hypothetical protein FRB90_003418 [Tulasnella sp. 427]|nr:hypothetical protein FRB90_003418 [Tulasnella sp. 427]